MSNTTHKSDNLLGFQEVKPVFVKRPFSAYGKQWKYGEEFNWINQPSRKEDWDRQRKRTQTLYNQGFIHHDSARESANKVGDRLSELNGSKLYELVSQLNAIVKKQTSSMTEFTEKKCKLSKIDDKQRGLIRQWLRKNTWAQEDFYRIRDHILGE